MKKLYYFSMLLFFLAINNNSVQSQWIEANTGLTSHNIYRLFVNNNRIYAGTYGEGIFISTDNGDNWIKRIMAGRRIQ